MSATTDLVKKMVQIERRVGRLERIETPVSTNNAGIVGQMLAVPGIRCFYPVSAQDESGQLQPFGATTTAMFDAGTSEVTYFTSGSATWCRFDGTNYMTRAALGTNITACYTFTESAYQGLTVGGWFRFDSAAAGASEMLISKASEGASAVNYYLYRTATGSTGFAVSENGTTLVTACATTLAASTMYHLVGRFKSGSCVEIFINGTRVRTVATSVSSLYVNNNVNFRVGATGNATGLFTGGWATCWFLSAHNLSDAWITSIYDTQKYYVGAA